ncbi:DUF7285 family protein [Haloplanus halobius]|uniref:DUF7285 family protein n=1 Tax=Haloplanus halobius TaxID=2934938 RepID=UPI00200E35D6|nr:hypothetical protein [Haloplanus sp. XH21]
MSRSSGRAQVEPLAALVVLVAVCAAVSTYAMAVDSAIPEPTRDVAAPTLERAVRTLATGGVVRPSRTARAARAAPSGYHLNVTVAAAGKRWHVGPAPPGRSGVDTAARSIGVRLNPGQIRPGRVRVEVWP